MTRGWGSAAVLIVVSGALGALDAQTITGRVLDETTDAPVGHAAVFLTRADGSEVARALADSAGRFALAAPSGSYVLAASRLGYEDGRTPLLEFSGERTPSIDLLLRPLPIGVEGLEVTATPLDAYRRELRQLYGVRLDDLGRRFVGREQIERRWSSLDAAAVLQWQNIPGLNVLRNENLSSNDLPFLCITWGPRVAGRESCMVPVLNGARVSLETLAIIPIESLDAMVVLSPDEATLLFGTGSPGAVLMFTRGALR